MHMPSHRRVRKTMERSLQRYDLKVARDQKVTPVVELLPLPPLVRVPLEEVMKLEGLL